MDSWAVVKLISLDRKLAFTSMLGSAWLTRKRKVYNLPSNKSDLRSHHDRLAISRPSYAIRKSIYKLGPQNHTHGPIAVMHLRPTSDWPVMLCDRLATDPRPRRDRLELPVWLRKSLHEIKISWVTCDRPPADLRPTCEEPRPKEDPLASWVTSKWNWQVPRPFLTVKSDHGACEFQWRVIPSYCEYSGVTYDLLVSNIGGTNDLATIFRVTMSLVIFWS